MNEREYDSDTLTADQILALLDLTLESWGECEFDRLVNLPSEELLGRFRKRLEANKLGLEQAAHLLAMNGLTLRSWLKSSKPLPEASHHKLAGLCLVLSLAEDADGSEAWRELRLHPCKAERLERCLSVATRLHAPWRWCLALQA